MVCIKRPAKASEAPQKREARALESLSMEITSTFPSTVCPKGLRKIAWKTLTGLSIAGPIEIDKVNAKTISIVREVKEMKKCFTLLSYRGRAIVLDLSYNHVDYLY
jgi:hypothetical protein